MTASLHSDAPAASKSDPRDIYTPERLNREARQLLERGLGSLWLEGEISNLSRPSSGHWYFSLKDQGAQLRAAMFRQRNLLVKFAPRDGMQVLVRGRVSLYEPRGDYQFLVDAMEEAGEGALRRQFEALKARLAAAGLFAAEHKRPLPSLPKRIGVITSPTGAAIRDILHILKRRFPAIPVLVYPVPVQGTQAAEQIAAAIALADQRRDCDVLILARGGGSLEDLWCFNEEIVARALFACQLPVITGIGHEVDFTIADFVADVRAPTPSGAAELVVPDQQQWLHSLASWQRRLQHAQQRRLQAARQQWVYLSKRLAQVHPGLWLRQRAQRLDELEQRLTRITQRQLTQHTQALQQLTLRLQAQSPSRRLADGRQRWLLARQRLRASVSAQLQRQRQQLMSATRTLQALSPLATLTRGYAIVTDSHGQVVHNTQQLQPGDRVQTRLAQGQFHAEVIELMTTDTTPSTDLPDSHQPDTQ